MLRFREYRKKKPENRDPNANHGRTRAEDYQGCTEEIIRHDELTIGGNCPDCTGTLGEHPVAKIIRLTGSPLIHGTAYSVEGFRCHTCRSVFKAKVPEEIETAPKYDVSCRTNIVLGRYGYGVPFKRIETWQSSLQIPLADATQWDLTTKMYGAVKPVFQCLMQLSSNAQGFYFDDTSGRILIPPISNTRNGIHTTAIAAEYDDQHIVLYFTSHQYGSENMLEVLSSRDSAEDFYSMSDASRNNLPRSDDSDLLARWILCFCLVHGRRKFFEIHEHFKPACEFVLNQISSVYHHERECQSKKHNAEQRLEHHQKHSKPILENLHIWLTNQWQYHQVEQNSQLGQAISYMLRHWSALTRFLIVPGVPIDNSFAERLIKVAIRHRRNSLFFRTTNGAKVGDCMMSFIQTARMAKINVFDYLNSLQHDAEAVAACPMDYLPWTYQKTIDAATNREQLAA